MIFLQGIAKGEFKIAELRGWGVGEQGDPCKGGFNGQGVQGATKQPAAEVEEEGGLFCRIGCLSDEGMNLFQMPVDRALLVFAQTGFCCGAFGDIPEKHLLRLLPPFQPVGMMSKVPQVACAGNECSRVGRVEKEDKPEMIFRNEVAVKIEVFQKRGVRTCPGGEPGKAGDQGQRLRCGDGCKEGVQAPGPMLGPLAGIKGLGGDPAGTQCLAKLPQKVDLDGLVLIVNDKE